MNPTTNGSDNQQSPNSKKNNQQLLTAEGWVVWYDVVCHLQNYGDINSS